MSGRNVRSDVSGGGFGHGYVRSGTEAFIHNTQINYSISVPIQVKYADMYAQVEDSYLRGLLEKAHLATNI